MIDTLTNWPNTESLGMALRAFTVLALGWIIALILSRLADTGFKNQLSPQGLFLMRRAIVYGIAVLTLISVLHQFGFNLGVLVGAAGILTVALGFASQTSASNLISGLFLVAEQPFRIGDVIRIGDLTGEVLSIDLLSIKLRTPDNLFVRVPNESLIKSNVTNISKFPIRRLDLLMKINYREDLERVRKALLDTAAATPICLVEPLPLFIVQGFGENGVDVQFSMWVRRENFLELRNVIARSVLAKFKEADIAVALPQVQLADAGSSPYG